VHGGGRRDEIGRAQKIAGTMTITDSRVVFVCAEFPAGGRWSGTGSAIRLFTSAPGTQQGSPRYLVGQVRHEWLFGVSAHARRRGRFRNALRLVSEDPTDASRQCVLQLVLPNGTASRDVGERVVRRAALARAIVADAKSAERLREFARAPKSKRLDLGDGVFWMIPRPGTAAAER
jgi:hypothetical protein